MDPWPCSKTACDRTCSSCTRICFSAAANRKRVYLLNHGDGRIPIVPDGLGLDPTAIVSTQDVMDELDFVIGLGAAMDRETVMALKQRGCKVICYKGGNGGVISIEGMVAKPEPRKDAELYFDHDYYDADLDDAPAHAHLSRVVRDRLSLPGL